MRVKLLHVNQTDSLCSPQEKPIELKERMRKALDEFLNFGPAQLVRQKTKEIEKKNSFEHAKEWLSFPEEFCLNSREYYIPRAHVIVGAILFLGLNLLAFKKFKI